MGREADLWSLNAGAKEMDDPYLWLEDVNGEKPLAWAKEQNRESVGELGQ